MLSKMKRRSEVFRWVPWCVLFTGMLLGPLWALFGGSAENPLDFRPCLWVAWSGEGGVPALAVVGLSAEFPREAWILLPGEGRAGQYLWEGMRRSGVEAASEFLVPSGRGFAKGAEGLASHLRIRRFSLCLPLRGKVPAESLALELAQKGCALQRLPPLQEGEAGKGPLWQGPLGQGTIALRRPAAGQWHGEWRPHGEDLPFLVFDFGKSGVLTVAGRKGELLRLPQATPGGWRRIPLPP